MGSLKRFNPTQNEATVARLKAAGKILLVKTPTTEFAYPMRRRRAT